MTFDTTPDPRTRHAGQVLLTQSELDELLEELASLRAAHRVDLAERLRDARGTGVAGDNDDQLAVFDDAVIERSRIAQLERLIAAATVVDSTTDGRAGLGSVVRVEDETGRQVEYEIVGRRSEDAERPQVTPGSPMGEALLGARAGDRVKVLLPNGRVRAVRVLSVA
ncbi:MAG TPA: GreA/GreB family elongation factor [Solirubrobacter sp.]|jgi:transcription elongation factor GreA|nr:GreA/GreB family elongation factor [Solirubrobacter sp.]